MTSLRPSAFHRKIAFRLLLIVFYSFSKKEQNTCHLLTRPGLFPLFFYLKVVDNDRFRCVIVDCFLIPGVGAQAKVSSTERVVIALTTEQGFHA